MKKAEQVVFVIDERHGTLLATMRFESLCSNSHARGLFCSGLKYVDPRNHTNHGKRPCVCR